MQKGLAGISMVAAGIVITVSWASVAVSQSLAGAVYAIYDEYERKPGLLIAFLSDKALVKSKVFSDGCQNNGVVIPKNVGLQVVKRSELPERSTVFRAYYQAQGSLHVVGWTLDLDDKGGNPSSRFVRLEEKITIDSAASRLVEHLVASDQASNLGKIRLQPIDNSKTHSLRRMSLSAFEQTAIGYDCP